MIDMNQKAVGCLRGEDAGQLLMAYLTSGAAMVQTAQPGAAVQKQPQGAGAGDQLIKPR